MLNKAHVTAAFAPAWWLRGAHAQTLWASLCRFSPRPVFHRQRLELADGDFLDLDWTQPNAARNVPLALILHGLEGSSRSSYVRGLASTLQRAGIQSVVLNFRGCSGTVNRLERTYHSGECADLDLIVRWLRGHFPGRPLVAVGYSLGGNVLLKWLGQRGPEASVDAAVAVCVPMLLAVCANRMERGFSRLYLWRLVRGLRRKVARKYAQRPGNLDLAQVARSRGFWSFDEHVTARLHGFRNATDYYQRASARGYLSGIAKPVLLVQARDDPFMTPAVLPAAREIPACVTLELSRRGGHVGFVAGRGLLNLVPSYWLDQRILAFIRTQLAN